MYGKEAWLELKSLWNWYNDRPISSYFKSIKSSSAIFVACIVGTCFGLFSWNFQGLLQVLYAYFLSMAHETRSCLAVFVYHHWYWRDLFHSFRYSGISVDIEIDTFSIFLKRCTWDDLTSKLRFMRFDGSLLDLLTCIVSSWCCFILTHGRFQEWVQVSNI